MTSRLILDGFEDTLCHNHGRQACETSTGDHGKHMAIPSCIWALNPSCQEEIM